MKKCKEKGDSLRKHSHPPTECGGALVKCRSSSKFVIGGRHGPRLSAPRHTMMVVVLLCLSVITTHLVGIGVADAQQAEPIQQISSAYSPSESLRNDPNLMPLTPPRHGGNLYAPQHGYDNNIEFVHDQTESIYEVPSQLDINVQHSSDSNFNNNNSGNDGEEPLDELPGNEVIGGAGDTYLHNGAPELEVDADLHQRPHHLDESLNENQLPDEENAGTSQFTELDGGVIVGQKILRQSESPYVLNTDLEVERGGSLTIEPGVTIEFAPMVGITIRGVITALVSDLLLCNWANVGLAGVVLSIRSYLHLLYLTGRDWSICGCVYEN